MATQALPGITEELTRPAVRADEKVTEPYMCRICFEETVEVGQLLAPCNCIGTQQYVHAKCLRKWQERILASGSSIDGPDDRAVTCSVCRTKYNVPLPLAAWRLRLMASLRSFVVAFGIGLIAFGLTGPPWPHLALIVLLLLGARSHSLMATMLLLLSSALAAMHARGLKLVMRQDSSGRLGMMLIRHGARVDGLAPGVLLVASEEMRNSIFRRSVVLLYQHSAAGASGVILTMPLDSRRLNEYRQGDALRHPTAVSHFLGGPVGMPSPGAAALERVLLHNMPALGATFVVPVNGSSDSAGGRRHVFVSDERASQAAAMDDDELVSAASAEAALLRMYHGVASWTGGQLEGEVRSGSWGFLPARMEDLTAADPAALWHRLLPSPDLQWL